MAGGVKVSIKNNVPQVMAALQKHILGNLRMAVEFVRTQVVKNISISFRAAGHSEPGEFPHLMTGMLRQSIRGEVDEATLTGYVGSHIFYSVFLEMGTSTMAPRPFLLRTVTENHDAIMRILSRPMGAGPSSESGGEGDSE